MLKRFVAVACTAMVCAAMVFCTVGCNGAKKQEEKKTEEPKPMDQGTPEPMPGEGTN